MSKLLANALVVTGAALISPVGDPFDFAVPGVGQVASGVLGTVLFFTGLALGGKH